MREGIRPGICALLACAVLPLAGCVLPRHSAASSAPPGEAAAAAPPSAVAIASEGTIVPAADAEAPLSPLAAGSVPAEPGGGEVQVDRVMPAAAIEGPANNVVPAPALAELPSAGTSTEVVLAQPPEVLPSIPPTDAVESTPLGAAATLPIDLSTALQITAGQNPEVAYARQRIQEAFAQMRAAEVLWVPSLRTGVNYNKHEGRIQDVAGNIIDTSRGSVYTGLGAQAVGAGSPAVPGVIMNFRVADAVYQPRITERVLAATQQASRATTNDTLLDTALAYIDLLETLQYEAVANETLENIRRLADLTGEFARTGQGLQSDADRAQAELSARSVEARRALEAVQVASIRLARLLSQDPSIFLAPQEPTLVPIDFVPLDCSLPELIATGLSNRPELAESRFLVGAAVERLRREQNAPLIPSVLLGLSYGGNGGGLGSDIDNFGDRLDFDAVAFWEIRNLGFGERAARGEARSRVEQARWRQVQAMDQVASDIAEAHTQVLARRDQIDLSESGITAARESYRRNSERIREGQGLPIETLQAVQALDQAQRQYVRSVADYNRSQFRLQRALGWPVQ
jgi:outer membrane protein TolC